MSDDALAASPTVAVIAAALVLLPAPAAMASSHTDTGGDTQSSPSYLDDWKALKGDLADGNVSDARSTYQSTFAGPAANQSAAKADVEAGFDAAANASGPDSVDYTVASQQIRKSLLAVAWANVQAAVTDGDGDRAAAWADILAAKFGGEVAEGADALANASADGLDEARAELGEAVRATATQSAAHEAEEVPGLIEGGAQEEAAAEAAEARYYSSIVLPHVEETLGSQDADALEGELDELLEAAEAGDASTAGAEAEEIVGIYARYKLQSAPREKAEAHADVKAHLEDGNVTDARDAYNEELADDAHEYARDAHQAVLDALDDAEAASPGSADYVEAEQVVAKGILWAATEVAFTEFEEKEFGEALEWYAVVAAKFGWFDAPSDAALAAGEAAALGGADEALDEARTGTHEKYLDKVREEVEEVFINWDDPVEAREKAAEGWAYYQPARDRVVTVLGSSPDEHLNEELEELLNATANRDETAAREAANETTKLLDQVEAGGEEVTELDALVSDLRGKVEFVLEEWRGYYEAKEAGDADEASTERGEAIAFANNALDLSKENRGALESGDAQAAGDLVGILEGLPSKLESNASLEPVRTDVQDALSALDTIKRGTAEGNVTVRLGPPEAGDAPRSVEIPVTLENLPAEQALGLNATITYDEAVIMATKVDVTATSGAGVIDAGQVRFNAALAQAGTSAEAAVVTFQAQQPLDEVGTVTLDLEVNRLENADSEPVGIQSIEDGSVDLASASSGEGSGAPGFGGAAALAVLAGAGVGLAALRRDR